MAGPGTRRIWQRPALRTDEDVDQYRAVSSLELFFDLVFVVVISRLGGGLLHHHDPADLVGFAAQFLAVFWVWNGFTFYTERFETDGLENRLLTFLAIVPVAGLAVFAQQAFTENFAGFAVAYLLARLVNQLSWARAGYHVVAFRPVSWRFHLGFAFGTALVLASLSTHGGLRVGLFTLAVLAEIATPRFTAGQQSMLPRLSTSKFPERFALFTLIVLGESVVGVIVALSELQNHKMLDGAAIAAGILGLGIGFALWWLYFDFVARRSPKPDFLTALIWVYLHAVALIAITATGAGISLVLDQAGTGSVEDASRYLLVGSIALALLGLAAVELTLTRADDEPTHPRLSPALKVGVAAVSGVIGALDLGWTSITLLLWLLAGLALPMGYGAYVWFIRSCNPTHRST